MKKSLASIFHDFSKIMINNVILENQKDYTQMNLKSSVPLPNNLMNLSKSKANTQTNKFDSAKEVLFTILNFSNFYLIYSFSM